MTDKIELYKLEYEHQVKLHKTQIGLIGRILELILGSDFYYELQYDLYEKYGLNYEDVYKE